MAKNALAFDFGASSGRAMLGSLENERLTIKEIHRFPNDPVSVGDNLYWDILRLFHEIKVGLTKAKTYPLYESIGIDCWGVDFGLIDKNGGILGNVRHYRDISFAKAMSQFEQIIPSELLYTKTGIQKISFNTIYQLYAMSQNEPWLLESADKLLFTPDLLAYMLTGQKACEYTIASTSSLLNVRTGDWDDDILQKLNLRKEMFCDIIMPGESRANLSEQICGELMIKPVKVISVCSHDTASAVLSVPSPDSNIAYISSGTWSLFGTELDVPDTSAAAMSANFTNEGGARASIRFLKNIMGLWLIQESRKFWKREGKEFSFEQLEQLACEATPFESFIDVDDPRFSPPGDMPGRVRDFCRETGQKVPDSTGEIMQCIYCSLAMKYREIFRQLSVLTGKDFNAINMVGGGIQAAYLCKLTADICGADVYAGPVEATVIGNLMMQFIALGEVDSIESARKIVRNSFEITHYKSENTTALKQAYARYKTIVKGTRKNV